MGKNKNNKPKNPMSNPKTMAREGMRIMKDIAFGRYNIYNDGHVFRNQDFVLAIIHDIQDRIRDLDIHIYAVSCVFNTPSGIQNPEAANLLYRDGRKRDAYVLIYNTLMSIYTTGDTGFLHILANKLPYYKYNI